MVVYNNWHKLEGFFEQGILHGFARIYNAKGVLTFFGFHKNGKPHGVCYKLIPDGGVIVGVVDEDGHLTGTEIVFLYPDFKTAFLGHFEDGVLMKAQATKLECVVEEDKLMIPLFAEPSGPHYKPEISNFDFITSEPLLPDPYESAMIEVKTSGVEGANEGLFVRHDVAEGAVLAFYNGIRRMPKATYDPPDWVVGAYRIFDPTRKKGSLDIPEEFRSLDKYCASLAHKTNHSFLPSAEFEAFDHPRFGLVPCLVASTTIKAGEEIFVHYGYGLDRCPDWFAEAWAKGNYPIPESFKEWHYAMPE